jgi:nucleotide-binding universal stress UspA family protein
MVGVDGSEAAAVAQGWAARLAEGVDAELVVATLGRSDEPDASAESGGGAAIAGTVDRPWAQLSQPPTDLAVRARVVSIEGGVGALLEAAAVEHADLTVVGRHRHGLVPTHLDHGTSHLMRHAERPLGIVPDGDDEPLPGTIVIGVDGTPESLAAVGWCADLASDLSAHVIAVAAWEPILEWVSPADPKSWRRELQHQLDRWITPMRERDVSVETVIVQDVNPAAALAATAERSSAHLLVVGARAPGRIGVRLGGVATHLVHHAVRPVVMVPSKS